MVIMFHIKYEENKIVFESLLVMKIFVWNHYNDIIMSTMASQFTSLMIVYSTVYSGADQRKHQSSTSLAFVWEIHWWPVNSWHKGPVMHKVFPFDDVIFGSEKSYVPLCDDEVTGRIQKWLAKGHPIHQQTRRMLQ